MARVRGIGHQAETESAVLFTFDPTSTSLDWLFGHAEEEGEPHGVPALVPLPPSLALPPQADNALAVMQAIEVLSALAEQGRFDPPGLSRNPIPES